MDRNLTVNAAQHSDIEGVLALLKKYHANSISDEDRKDGFVTTNIDAVQLAELIEKENGLVVAKDGDQVVGFVIAGSWQFLQRWPMFEYMTGELHKYTPYGEQLDSNNSYQYGPICIDGAYRGNGLANQLFDCSAQIMAQRFAYLVTFINKINGRSYAAHTRKLQLDDSGSFGFNNNQYHLMTLDLRPLTA